MKTSKIHPVRLCLLLILSYWIASFGSGFIFMKEIQLTRGMVAMVDDEDFKQLNQFKWKANPGHSTFYASRNIYVSKGKWRTEIMHRVIMGVTDSKKMIDHRDHNGLNNQKSNLRVCTNKQNIYNTKSRKNSTSKYLGVSWKPSIKRWHVMIQKDGKFKYLGVYKDEKLAALAYNKEAEILFGEFANLNVVS